MNYPGLWKYKFLLLTRKHSDNTIRPVIIRWFSWWCNVRIFSSLSFRVLYDWSAHQQNRISLQREKHRYTWCPLSLTSKTFDALTEILYHSDDVSIFECPEQKSVLVQYIRYEITYISSSDVNKVWSRANFTHRTLTQNFQNPSHWVIDPLRTNRSSLI